jgi:hypothetical protein
MTNISDGASFLNRLQRKLSNALPRESAPSGKMQVVQAAQKEQISDLLNHFNRVGNAARPEGVPNLVNFAFEIAGEHE